MAECWLFQLWPTQVSQERGSRPCPSGVSVAATVTPMQLEQRWKSAIKSYNQKTHKWRVIKKKQKTLLMYFMWSNFLLVYLKFHLFCWKWPKLARYSQGDLRCPWLQQWNVFPCGWCLAWRWRFSHWFRNVAVKKNSAFHVCMPEHLNKIMFPQTHWLGLCRRKCETFP